MTKEQIRTHIKDILDIMGFNTMMKQSDENARHIAILNDETGELRDIVREIGRDIKCASEERNTLNNAMVRISTDVDWLKRSYWLIATASVGALITGIFGILTR